MTHLVKIKLNGDLRIMEIPSPPFFAALVDAVSEAYALPAGNKEELTFTYKDADGDEVRFDTDAELDLAIRTSTPPLRVSVQNPRTSKPNTTRPSIGGNAPAAAPPAPTRALDNPPAQPSIPSTPGYAVASNVGSAVGDDDEDMIMVDLPREQMGTACDVASGGDAAPEKEVEEIDAPAAFEVEASAARDPEGSLLFQKASMRLAKRFKVHLTPTQLWRVMALFQIQGRKLVIFGLAPRRALDTAADPSAPSGASSDEEGRGGGGGVKRSKDYLERGMAVVPVHRLLQLNGIDLPEEEVQPLLEALHVRPRRLVKLGLLPIEAIGDWPGGHGERGARGEPFGRRMHPHGGRFERCGGRGNGGRGRHPKVHIGPWGLMGGRGPGHHGPPGMEGGPPPRDAPPPPHHPPHPPPPPHQMGGPHSFPGHPEGPRGEHGPKDGADWHGPPHGMYGHPGSHHHMWHGPPGSHGFAGGFGPPPGPHGHPGDYGPPGMMGGWGAWSGAYGGGGYGGGYGGGGFGGGGGGGGRACGVKEGLGKGTKDKMAMARFVAHASGTDVTKVAGGQTFKKSWLVRNDSTTTWPETCSLVPVSQNCEDLSSPPEAPVVGDVAPGEEATVSVDLVAPLQPGMYEGFWRVRDSELRKFGQRLWAKVKVVGQGEEMDAAVEKLSLEDGNKDN